MERAFWHKRRVLITGHTGFKGSWLSLWLARLGAEVTGYALAPPSEPSLFELAAVEDGLGASITADVRDGERLARAVEDAGPEVVFHLAAQSLVRESYRAPADTYATNVMGTVHLLEAIRRTPGVKAVVVVTSDKCYDNREWVWPYRENDPLGGHDPYASSKACAELVTAAYRASYFDDPAAGDRPAIASARAGNVVGGGDWAADRLVPDVARAVAAGDVVHLRSPHAIRPWQHVLEPLAGYLLLAERLAGDGREWAEAWNFGPEERDARSVGWLVEQLAARWHGELRWTRDERSHPHEAHTLKLDSSKARARLGWRPRLSLERALDWLVEWYRAHREGADLGALTRAQIARYEKLPPAP